MKKVILPAISLLLVASASAQEPADTIAGSLFVGVNDRGEVILHV